MRLELHRLVAVARGLRPARARPHQPSERRAHRPAAQLLPSGRPSAAAADGRLQLRLQRGRRPGHYHRAGVAGLRPHLGGLRHRAEAARHGRPAIPGPGALLRPTSTLASHQPHISAPHQPSPLRLAAAEAPRTLAPGTRPAPSRPASPAPSLPPALTRTRRSMVWCTPKA